MAQWDTLMCTHCSGTLFFRPFEYIKHATQGTSEKPTGAVCFTCGRDGDPHVMWMKMETSKRVRELEELQEKTREMEERQRKLDDLEFEKDPVEMRDIVVKRARSVREREAEHQRKKTTGS